MFINQGFMLIFLDQNNFILKVFNKDYSVILDSGSIE